MSSLMIKYGDWWASKRDFGIERNIFWLTLQNNFQPRNINKTKLHLSKSETWLLWRTFARGISNILHWHEFEVNDKENSEVEKCKSISQNLLLNNELNFMRINHVSQLFFTHLNINPLRNKKFEFFVEFVSGKVNILSFQKSKLTKASHWANLKLVVLIHHFFLITVAAVGYYASCSGRYTGKTERLWKTSNRKFSCRNESRKAKVVDKLFF